MTSDRVTQVLQSIPHTKGKTEKKEKDQRQGHEFRRPTDGPPAPAYATQVLLTDARSGYGPRHLAVF